MNKDLFYIPKDCIGDSFMNRDINKTKTEQMYIGIHRLNIHTMGLKLTHSIIVDEGLVEGIQIIFPDDKYDFNL